MMKQAQTMTCYPTSGGADAVSGSPGVGRDPELGSGVGPASKQRRWAGEARPLRSYLELGALPEAVGCARLHVKHILWEWELGELTDSIELLVSELVTNAQRASAELTGSRYRGQWRPGVPPVRLWLDVDQERALIQVWDGDHHLPERQEADLDAESGRGLLLVESLSAEWGAYLLEGSSGKIVWASVARGDSQ